MVRKPWWKHPEGEKHTALFASVKAITSAQKFRQQELERFAKLYGNLDIVGLVPWKYSRPKGSGKPEGRLTFNVVQSVVDTKQAKVAKNRPRPMFLTQGGNFRQRQEAKKLTKFADGLFYETKAYEKGQRVFIDAEVFGTGAIKVYREGDKVCLERVLVPELHVDEAEAFYGEPRALYQEKYVDRDVLLEMFPEHEAAIRLGGDEGGEAKGTAQGEDDLVLVREAWRLPSSKDAGDGRHVIAIEGATLLDEEWKKDRFPFAFLRSRERMFGFWGQGAAERLQGIQLDINKNLSKVQRLMHNHSTTRVVKRKSAKIPDSMITNSGADIIETEDPASDVVIHTANGVPSELFGHIREQIQRAYEQEGISQLSAGSKKPPGLDSGVALREHNDIEAERFVILGQGWESFFMDVAGLMLDLAKEIADETGEDGKKKGYQVRAPDKRTLEFVDLKEISLTDDKYEMRVFPVSALPTTPAYRQQTVTEWAQMGLIPPEEMRRLLDFPDLEQSTDLATAQYDDIQATLDAIVEDGEYSPPEPFQNLALGVKWAQSRYLRAKREGLPESRLELLRTWMDSAVAMLAPPAPQGPQLPTPPTEPALPAPTIPAPNGVM